MKQLLHETRVVCVAAHPSRNMPLIRYFERSVMKWESSFKYKQRVGDIEIFVSSYHNSEYTVISYKRQ
jgi:hypothetical protein